MYVCDAEITTARQRDPTTPSPSEPLVQI